MKTKTATLTVAMRGALVTFTLIGGLTLAGSAPARALSAPSRAPAATLPRPHTNRDDTATTTTSTSTSTSTTTTSTTLPITGGLIYDGASRRQCLAPHVIGSGLSGLQAAITKFDGITDTSVSCVSTYLNGAPTWSSWEHPWVAKSQFGYTSWVAEAPRSRQLVMQVDLIPDSLKNVNDPLGWERSCAAGHFDSHATQLGDSLVAAGLQNSVIRLGAEMNGSWESDFVGTTASEQRLWVRCFANEVTALRQASGEHFLIDWNPSPCEFNISYTRLYPGNAYVNIMGLDLFDESCSAPKTRFSFAQLANAPAGLTSFEAFARVHRKPMSLPEWGLSTVPSGDDPKYIDGIGSTFDSRNFSFETYFDGSGGKFKALALGSKTPLSVPAFQQWFSNGNGSKS